MSDRVSWLLYLVGSLLVFASWMDIVPNDLGWIGWLMALGGWAFGTRRYRWDEEFQLQKRRLLGQP
jgi:hypothetical protein